MLSKAFKIVEPRRFDLYIEDHNLLKNEVLVKVDYLSICKADLRYYEGSRDKRTLALKYPMSLIHEATGIIVKDPSGTLQRGTRVVLIPNEVKGNCDIDCVCHNEKLGENYCSNASFASSNIDGFSKEYVKLSLKQLIKIADNLQSDIAVFSEMISVACAAIRRVENLDGKIGIWGDGILGYILAATLKTLQPNLEIIAIGKHKDKLEQFCAIRNYLIDEKIEEQFDIVFECVGGNASSGAINQALDCLKIGGEIVLTGVAEELVPINTRKILEKGIVLTGTTRSQRADFELAQKLFEDESFKSCIQKLNLSENIVTNINDYYKVFEQESNNKKLGKNIIKLYL